MKISIAKYSIAGLLTGELLRIIFSKRKYVTAIQQDDFSITVRYLNRMLFKKSVSIDKEDLSITDVTETNWWNGNLDLINFSNAKHNLTFKYIDKNIKQVILEILEKE